LAFSFAAAIAIAGCVVVLFSRSIDEALGRVIPTEFLPAWRQYAKFALFTVTLVGGMRLKDLAAFVMLRGPGAPPALAGVGLLEVLQTISGALVAASSVLLAFFVATLAIDASMRVHWFQRAAERPAPQTPQKERQPVGAERHAGAKDRPRTEESGRYL